MALADNALTTIATCEAELGLTASAQDALLTRYINGASDIIEQYIGRSLYNDGAAVEDVPGAKDAFLFVDRSPIVSITSIVWLGDNGTVDASTYSVWDADAGMIYRADGWEPTKISATAFQRYRVTFDGGYVTPEQGGTRTLPFDIENVCVDLVNIMWRQKGADPTVKSESVLNTSISYDRSGMLTGAMMRVLDAYRRHDMLTSGV
jgi:hypothetical protein